MLDEFLAIIKAQTSLGMGAGNYIRNVMVKALGEDKSQSVLSRIAPTSSSRPIEILDWMDARSIAELVADEHPQIIALVISYLDAGLGVFDVQFVQSGNDVYALRYLLQEDPEGWRIGGATNLEVLGEGA